VNHSLKIALTNSKGFLNRSCNCSKFYRNFKLLDYY